MPSEFRWTLSHARANKNWINHRSQDTLGLLLPVCLKKTRCRRNAINTHNNLYFGDSDSAGRYFAITRWNVWDGLVVRVGIIIFHLFFILILLKRARRRERGKLARSLFLWCLGMFLRGVLEVGHGGPEESANKQVAEGGRGETLIPCCARPLILTKTCVRASPWCASHSHGSTRRIKKRPPRAERVQVILPAKRLCFDVVFFTGSRNIPLAALWGLWEWKAWLPVSPPYYKLITLYFGADSLHCDPQHVTPCPFLLKNIYGLDATVRATRPSLVLYGLAVWMGTHLLGEVIQSVAV